MKRDLLALALVFSLVLSAVILALNRNLSVVHGMTADCALEPTRENPIEVYRRTAFILTVNPQGPHWTFASMNPSRVEDDTLSNGATGVAFWTYKAPGDDQFSHSASLHSFHVNVALQKPAGAPYEPSFHFGFLVSPTEPGTGSPSIAAGLSNGTQAEGSTTRWDIKIPRGDINSRSWYVVLQNGQDSSGKWKWDYWVYIFPRNEWHHVTTVHVDSPYIGRSPNMNAEIAAGGGVSACDDRFTPVTFYRVHVLKDGVWQNIPYLVIDYTTDNPPFEDCPAMDWDIIDSGWATASTKGRDTPRGTEWNDASTIPETYWPPPVIDSVDANGNIKNTFDCTLNEKIYVKGSNFPPATTFKLYFVPDGAEINPTNSLRDKVRTITSDSFSNIPITEVGLISTVGKYDLWADVNDNGVYDPDDVVKYVEAGKSEIIVIPEFHAPTIFLVALLFVMFLWKLELRVQRRGQDRPKAKTN